MNLSNIFEGLTQSDSLQKVKAYVTFTSNDIFMIFTVKVEIVNLMVKILSQTKHKFSPEIGSKRYYQISF